MIDGFQILVKCAGVSAHAAAMWIIPKCVFLTVRSLCRSSGVMINSRPMQHQTTEETVLSDKPRANKHTKQVATALHQDWTHKPLGHRDILRRNISSQWLKALTILMTQTSTKNTTFINYLVYPKMKILSLFFLVWKTKEDILKSMSAPIYFHRMDKK